MRRSHNDVDISQRTATPPEGDDAERQDDVSLSPWMNEAERMTRTLQRGIGKYWGFLTDPEQRAEYVRGLAEMLSRDFTPDGRLGGPGSRPKVTTGAQVPNHGEDSEFLDDPEKWNRSKKL